VAVFSGTARERLSDAEFADDETDTTLGRRLAEEGGDPYQEPLEQSQALGVAGKELLGAVGAVAGVALRKTSQALREAAAKAEREGTWPKPDAESADQDVGEVSSAPSPPSAPEPVPDRAVREKKDRRRGNVGLSVLSAIGLLAIANVCLLTIAIPTHLWELYDRGWPIQIFLASWGLSIIMYVSSSLWLLIPTGPAFVTAIILAYCQLTGNWEHWSFLWIFEVWGGVVSIFTPIFLARSGGFARWLSRFLAVLFSLLSIVAIIWIAVVVGAGGLFGNWIHILMP
jgi:hypothetical protein